MIINPNGTNNSTLIQDWINKKNYYTQTTASAKKTSEIKVLTLFKKASKLVPAYKDFLNKNGIKPSSIKTIAEYNKIPPITKENYITKYTLQEKCWNGTLTGNHTISTSSGTLGEPHFWPRDFLSEVEGAYIHELILNKIFNINEGTTLFINGFAMGNWIAGTFTASCINLLALKGYKIVNLSPGYILEEVINVLNNLGSFFDRVIITGHTPFLKEILEDAHKKEIINKIKRIYLLGTGQAITESWRKYMLNLLHTDYYFDTMVNLYGSADASLMGFETPLSIYIRKTISDGNKMNYDLFKSERIPSLYQFDPRFTYFEDLNNELLITKNSGIPLIRYNIQDKGGIIQYEDLAKKFKPDQVFQGYKKDWQLPFVYLFGRDRFMIKLYGANVYSENINTITIHKNLQNLITGRFMLELAYDTNNDQIMVCRFELNREIESSNQISALIEQTIVEEVSKVNSEYRDVLKRVGIKAKPKVILHTYNDPKYFRAGKVKKYS